MTDQNQPKDKTSPGPWVFVSNFKCADGLAEIARQWESDHSSGADRRGWVLAKDARDDALRLLQDHAKRIGSTTPPAPDHTEQMAQIAEIAGLESSIGHLSALVDDARSLLKRAMQIMKELHESVEPDESQDGVPAVIPGAAFAQFVDAHAELMHAIANSPHTPPATQPLTRDQIKHLATYMPEGVTDDDVAELVERLDRMRGGA